jgi:hypothetical protein
MFEYSTNYTEAYPTEKETLLPPPTKLGYHSNNKYAGFPPLMSDGRTITASWQPEALVNEELIKTVGIQTNWQYRQYLTKNAKEIMKYNYVETSTDSAYLYRYDDLDSDFSTPHTYTDIHDKSQPVGFQPSDLKSLYLTREQLQSRMIAPELTLRGGDSK